MAPDLLLLLVRQQRVRGRGGHMVGWGGGDQKVQRGNCEKARVDIEEDAKTKKN